MSTIAKNILQRCASLGGPGLQFSRSLNANRAVVTKIGRTIYERTYPDTLMVKPDGSTIRIRYHIPRQIIKLPFDIQESSMADLKRIKALRTQREKKTDVGEDLKVKAFDPLDYLN
ncbi:large ribosomal subunit protein mL55-like [Tigriopus californicus]|uniref:large ribosomal subunit protein mL55-like n=1 Tax=Tigriopus californicus TaxID=6832 RepID=UPI0027D9D75A|nr:large ribosomal subunit protein mL55-like [Tigriopus californicus]|eukprot:TCALIF_10088-PA protein Name:"Similar to mRpL55 39S ribosomal protein L55, mitochondrial (Drosophila melanogaster)" AED:0.26 eAED:0.26 QI:99/1/1/1/0.66/0.5/4/1911/115